LKQDPDQALIGALARGEKQAAGELLTRHGDRLMAVAFRLLSDRQLAEDMVQETLIKAIKQAPTWQPGKALFSTWMHRVIVNGCYDHLRKKATKTEISGLEHFPDRADESPDALAKLAGDDVSAAMSAALENIPPRQKQAIVLFYYEDLSGTETAEILELTVEAVESLLVRGRKSLRQQLAKSPIRQDVLEM
jgi:RNA polymerase sigma-70 factor, ECF subfamily